MIFALMESKTLDVLAFLIDKTLFLIFTIAESIKQKQKSSSVNVDYSFSAAKDTRQHV